MTGWMTFQAFKTESMVVPPARGENPGVVYMPHPVKVEAHAVTPGEVVKISEEEEGDSPMDQ